MQPEEFDSILQLCFSGREWQYLETSTVFQDEFINAGKTSDELARLAKIGDEILFADGKREFFGELQNARGKITSGANQLSVKV